ncbi:uncharacterized protein LOC119081759 [Bradysia coprophila]|uniref:uncharacterized protein LOC119081759 n=1 Tax=Bradysia coprophila TaxID=38358 RepID=UPI00187D9E02|nr:uncharacterized protein LOC119081759 [Bradysia coprophila]
MDISSKMFEKGLKFSLSLRAPRTVTELKLIKVSQTIRAKPDWMEKLKNPTIVAKWKSECAKQNVNETEFQYILDELRYYAALTEGPIEIGPVDGTWQSDRLIDEQLQTAFKESVFELLENVDESEKDYHPGSKNLVVDLVHPSLFCFVRGVSKITDETGINADTIKELSEVGGDDARSSNYRWLPSDTSCDENGVITFDSYINNLPPEKNAALYTLIGRILSKFMPMFSRVLRDVAHPRQHRIVVNDCNWWHNETEFEYDEDDNHHDEQEQFEEWKRSRVLRLPEIPKFEPPTLSDISDFDFKGQKFQVIVKLANIELTPNNPKYKGGVWHTEATESEAIVATGIYYYSMENITESILKFRQATDDPPYEQDDREGVYQVFGMENEGHLNQRLGNLIAREGRCVVFPNVYQHKVAPFELVDKTKGGHRKILVFFLIDPMKRVISTRNVAPQNPIWDDKPVDRFTMTLEAAEKYREDLMSERKYYRNEVDKELYEREFSLCEH